MFSRRLERKSSVNIRFDVCGSVLEKYDENEILIQKPLFDVNLKEYSELEMFYDHF